MIEPTTAPPVEGFSEERRQDLHRYGVGKRLLSFVQSTPKPVLECVDVYHGDVITDQSALPHLPCYLNKASEGGGYQDPTAAQRVSMWQTMGIQRVGLYHWLRTDSSIDAQFDNFRKAVAKTTLVDKAGALVRGGFVAADIERTYLGSTALPDPSKLMIEEWNGRIEREWGARQINYSANWVTSFEAWRAANPTFPLWYAAYNLTLGLQLALKYKSMCWQYTSTAVVAGFNRPVDGSTRLQVAEFDLVCGIMAAPEPKPPAPTPIPVTPPYHELGDDMAGIGVARLDDSGAEFLFDFYGSIDKPRILSAHWLNSPAKVAAAHAQISVNGAAVFGDFEGMQPTPGAARLVKANFANIYVDILPTGDTSTWTYGVDCLDPRN